MPYKDESVRKAYHKLRSREHYLRNREEIIQKAADIKKQFREDWGVFKSSLKCTKCGYDHPAALDFHHVDPKEKEGNIHRFLSNGQYKKLEEELKKCVVLCANCHRVHHWDEKKNPAL